MACSQTNIDYNTAFQKGLAISIISLGFAFSLGMILQSHRSDIDRNSDQIKEKAEFFDCQNSKIELKLKAYEDKCAKNAESIVRMESDIKHTRETTDEIKEILKNQTK